MSMGGTCWIDRLTAKVEDTLTRYHAPVALNIKDPEVDRLAAELAARWGTTKTDAIRRALTSQLSLLQTRRTDEEEALLEVMRTEVWPLLDDRRPVSKAEREQILGYEPGTGV